MAYDTRAVTTGWREAGCVVGIDGSVLYWHTPFGASGGTLPDPDGKLWDMLWRNRHRVLGVAHTHPGKGQGPEAVRPSLEDLTTFSALELALGRRFLWWIANARNLAVVVNMHGREGTASLQDYITRWVPPSERLTLRWLDQLRLASLSVKSRPAASTVVAPTAIAPESEAQEALPAVAAHATPPT